MRILAHLRRGVIYLLPMTLLLVAIGVRLVAPDLLDRLSLIAFDFYQRAAPRQPGNAPIRIIDIDDKSLKEIGQWPWPRTIVAQMIDRLAATGAAVIAFDIDFAEPDRTSPKLLLPLIAQNGVGLADAEKLLRVLPDPDQALAVSVKKIPVATGFILTDRGETRPPAEKAGFAMNGTDPLAHTEGFPKVVPNLPVLEAAAAGNGFLNQYLDWDHVVRRVPLILTLTSKPYPSSPAGTPYPSLAAEALRLAFGASTYILRASGANAERNFGQDTGLTAIRIGEVTVPTDAAGRVWLHYAAHDPHLYISAADILAGNFDPARVSGHIVLVGTSASGVINDCRRRRWRAAFPGSKSTPN